MTALVTRAGHGIGRVYAVALAEARADVAIVDNFPLMAEEAAQEIKGLGHRSPAIVADVRTRYYYNRTWAVVSCYGRDRMVLGIPCDGSGCSVPAAAWLGVSIIAAEGFWRNYGCSNRM